MRILAIETSCDDTGIAVLEYSAKNQPKLLTDLISSQVKIHAPWGGVVPTLAKREHQKNLTSLFKQALTDAGLLKIQPRTTWSPGLSSTRRGAGQNSKFQTLNSILEREPKLIKKLNSFLKKYQKPEIDLIAVTVGPGLEPALWTGVNFARALGYFWDLPIVSINHLEGHITAAFAFASESESSAISQSPNFLISKNTLPAICLVVSGGHTQLILMKKFGCYQILGETRDDAAGEAFDKVAKMLNLGYPGGPIISQLATKSKSEIRNPKSKTNPKVKILNSKHEIKLPRPMINTSNYDFSFSGLKTAVLYFVKTLTPKQLKKLTPAICAEFQQAVVDVLVSKTIRAAKEFQTKTVLLSGGVAANDLLRDTLRQEAEKLKSPTSTLPLLKKGGGRGEGSVNFSVPPKNFCTDNAAMIALTAYFRIKNRESRIKNREWQKINVDANLRIA